MSPSKRTEMPIAIKTNKENTKNKHFLKKTRCRCNGKLVLLCHGFSKVLNFALQI